MTFSFFRFHGSASRATTLRALVTTGAIALLSACGQGAAGSPGGGGSGSGSGGAPSGPGDCAPRCEAKATSCQFDPNVIGYNCANYVCTASVSADELACFEAASCDAISASQTGCGFDFWQATTTSSDASTSSSVAVSSSTGDSTVSASSGSGGCTMSCAEALAGNATPCPLSEADSLYNALLYCVCLPTKCGGGACPTTCEHSMPLDSSCLSCAFCQDDYANCANQ